MVMLQIPLWVSVEAGSLQYKPTCEAGLGATAPTTLLPAVSSASKCARSTFLRLEPGQPTNSSLNVLEIRILNASSVLLQREEA